MTIVAARWSGSAAHEIVDGIEVIRRGGRLTVYLRTAAHLVSRRGRSYDVVVDVVNGIPFGAAALRRRTTVALIHHVHREQWHMLYPGLVGRIGWTIESRIVPRLYRRRHVITVSDQSRADLLGLGHRSVTVVRNGVDPSDLPRRRDGHRLVVLARLVPHKQVHLAIDAVAALATELPDMCLDVVGDGFLRAALQQHAINLSVSDRVVFHGHLSDEARDLVLASSAAVVLPSLKEGWGLALVEGAAVGVPGIALRAAGGVTEAVIDGETGLIAEDSADVVRVCRRLLLDDELNERLGSQARRRAATLTWSDAASAMENLVAQEP